MEPIGKRTEIPCLLKHGNLGKNMWYDLVSLPALYPVCSTGDGICPRGDALIYP